MFEFIFGTICVAIALVALLVVRICENNTYI